ncbi:hypothetical protein [Pseudarthrobacter phenanthrenivorans]|uniref:hypothetical protein n=1 Tax=Pseudarthrobacter phenanthrenivorans TaxID=361575 RepID=UPI0011D208EC|nr:hypothetical protein [Pseudarthrobacter phenanthrenivorans]
MRAHDVRKFRAVGARLDWLDIARRMLRAGHGEGIDDALLERLKERGPDTRLAWGCSADLGVPRDAFTVWARPVRDRRLQDAGLVGVPVDEGELVWWESPSTRGSWSGGAARRPRTCRSGARCRTRYGRSRCSCCGPDWSRPAPSARPPWRLPAAPP